MVGGSAVPGKWSGEHTRSCLPDASAVLTLCLASGTARLLFRVLVLRELPVAIVIFLNAWSHGTQVGFEITLNVVEDNADLPES